MVDDNIDDMVIGTTCGQLSNAEREKRYRENLCLYCGEPWHIKSSCKKLRNCSSCNQGNQLVGLTQDNDKNGVICLLCGSDFHDMNTCISNFDFLCN